MAVIEIQVQPAEGVSRFETSIVLEQVRYTFAFYTITERDGWAFDLTDDTQTLLLAGIGLTGGVDLLYPYRYLPVPPGALFVNDQALTRADPTIDGFASESVALYYVTSDEAFA